MRSGWRISRATSAAVRHAELSASRRKAPGTYGSVAYSGESSRWQKNRTGCDFCPKIASHAARSVRSARPACAQYQGAQHPPSSHALTSGVRPGVRSLCLRMRHSKRRICAALQRGPSHPCGCGQWRSMITGALRNHESARARAGATRDGRPYRAVRRRPTVLRGGRSRASQRRGRERRS